MVIANTQFAFRTQAQAPVPTRARSDLRAGVYVPLSKEPVKAETPTEEKRESAHAGLDGILSELEGIGLFLYIYVLGGV